MSVENQHTFQWYVVQVLSTHEKKVKKALEEQRNLKKVGNFIDEVVLPIEKVSEMKKGEQHIVEKRLWPGYLLVKMQFNDESWDYVKNTTGVIGFLGGDSPTPLSEKEVNEILDDLAERRENVTQRHQIEVGDSVKIIEGVFINFTGTVTDVFHDKGKLNLIVSIFGRETEVDDLDFTQVEEINDEADVI